MEISDFHGPQHIFGLNFDFEDLDPHLRGSLGALRPHRGLGLKPSTVAN